MGTGDGTCYTYDAIGNLTSVRPATYSVADPGYTAVVGEEVEYVYDATTNLLDSIRTESTTYNFNYTAFGSTDSIAVGTQQLASYTYNAYNGKLNTITYGNGFTVRYVYDDLDNVKEIWYNNTKAYEYSYTTAGQLYRFDNLTTGKSIRYTYDASGSLVGMEEYKTSDMENVFAAEFAYDDDNGYLLLAQYDIEYEYKSSGTTQHRVWYRYEYNSDMTLKDYDILWGNYVATPQYNSITYTYDGHKRLSQKSYSRGYTVNYTFTESGYNTSGQVATYTSTVGSTAVTYTYTYDGKGNITKITLSTGEEYRYVYDNLGQLLREDNTKANRTYVYTYDDAGNITSKKIYPLTAAGTTPAGTPIDTYSYGYTDAEWGDKLTSYDDHTITYDAIGNPLSYYNGESYTFEWKNGRQLEEATYGTYALSFDYNDDGIRTQKVVNGVEHNYYLSGSKIFAEEWEQNDVTHLCIYLYDAEGTPVGMQYRNSTMNQTIFYTFWFEKNLQGDIVAVYDTHYSTKLISYSYDAWGVVTQTNHNVSDINAYAQYNPFKYRGYYYDAEMQLYYLNTRYYDPAIGRFISADGLAYLGANGNIPSYNLYVYCSNNPVMGYDPMGTFSWGNLIAAVIVVTVQVAAIAVGVTLVASMIPIIAAPAAVGLAVAGTGLLAGGVSIANQLVEEGDIVDIDPIIDDVKSEMISEAITLGLGDTLETTALAINTVNKIGSGFVDNVNKGDSWHHALVNSMKEVLTEDLIEQTYDAWLVEGAGELFLTMLKIVSTDEDK